MRPPRPGERVGGAARGAGHQWHRRRRPAHRGRGNGPRPGRRPVEYFTFRRRVATGAGEFAEDALVRGVHPLEGRRLHLWRLQNFHVTRVGDLAPIGAGPVTEGVLLYHCVAKDNPDDQRLVALAQVHRFEVARDSGDRITEIEDAQTVLAACADAIGRARHDLDPAGQWLDMNHVWLDIRPVAEIGPEELAAWQRAIAPWPPQAGIEEVLVQGRLADAGRHAPLRGDPAVLRAGRQRRRLGGGAAHPAARAAERLPAEGAAGTPPRHGVPVRAGGAADWPAGRIHRARPAAALDSGRPRGHPVTTPRESWSASSPRRRHCTRKASGGSCCSATPPRRWGRCLSRNAPA